MSKFEGKVALVSGAARGQGRAHALRLAEEGADLALIDVAAALEPGPNYPMPDEADLEAIVGEVEGLGARVVWRRGDVRDREILAELVEAADSELGGIDLVIANAGITTLGPAVEMSGETWDEMMGINLTGAWNTVQAPLRGMIDADRGGSIVITSSTAGLIGMPGLAHYAAAKHGVVGLMKSLANELAPHGIRVNTVHPTNVGTPMILNEGTYAHFRPDLESPTQEDAAPAFMSYHLLQVPWIDVADVSNAVLWLLSDEARYVTGATLPVDCGVLAKFPD